MKKIAKVGFVLLATGLLAACATKSKITPEGTTDEPRFPKPYSLTFNKDRVHSRLLTSWIKCVLA